MTAARRPSAPELASAIGRSKLDPTARHCLRVLKDRMNFRSRVITADRMPSLTDIEQETGYARSTVREALFRLEDDGWITRFPPPVDQARRKHARTRYELHLPGSDLMHEVRGGAAGPDHRERRKLYAERVRVGREAKGRVEGVPDWAADDELRELAARTFREVHRRDVDDAIARAAVAGILGGKRRDEIRTTPARYLAASIRKDGRRFLPTDQPPPPPSSAAVTGDEPPAAWHQQRAALARRPRKGTK